MEVLIQGFLVFWIRFMEFVISIYILSYEIGKDFNVEDIKFLIMNFYRDYIYDLLKNIILFLLYYMVVNLVVRKFMQKYLILVMYL